MKIETIERIDNCRQCWCLEQRSDGLFCLHDDEDGIKIGEADTIMLHFPEDCPLESVEGKTEQELKDHIRELYLTKHLRDENGNYIDLPPTPEA